MTKKPKAIKAASLKTQKPANTENGPKPVVKQALVKSAKPVPPRAVKGTVRENSKQALLIEMLKRASGTTIPKIMDVTGWQQHSVRGFLSGTIKKKLGLKISTDKAKDGVRTYRIKAA